MVTSVLPTRESDLQLVLPSQRVENTRSSLEGSICFRHPAGGGLHNRYDLICCGGNTGRVKKTLWGRQRRCALQGGLQKEAMPNSARYTKQLPEKPWKSDLEEEPGGGGESAR